ncbi:MAG: hypothetical protein ACR2KE_08860 [Candidatus Nanopelagicales bacterium]
MRSRALGSLRVLAAGVVAVTAVATPVGSALGASRAASSNFLQLSILTATYRVSAVLPSQVATNTTGPLIITLNATNQWGQPFYLQNIGDLDVVTLTLSHTGPYGNGANRVDLAYCAGGTAGGAFVALGTCAGGGTLTTVLQGKGSAVLGLTIPTGTARAFQATTRSRSNGQDTTDTISVVVSLAGVVRRGVTTS